MNFKLSFYWRCLINGNVSFVNVAVIVIKEQVTQKDRSSSARISIFQAELFVSYVVIKRWKEQKDNCTALFRRNRRVITLNGNNENFFENLFMWHYMYLLGSARRRYYLCLNLMFQFHVHIWRAINNAR